MDSVIIGRLEVEKSVIALCIRVLRHGESVVWKGFDLLFFIVSVVNGRGRQHP